MSPASTTIPDIGEQYVNETRDYAWQAAGEATEARAGAWAMRAHVAGIRAHTAALGAEQAAQESGRIAAQAGGSEAQAEAALSQALGWENQTKQLLANVEQHSYELARASAEKEVAVLEGEAHVYYASLLRELQALAMPQPTQDADKAAQAAKPYLAVVTRLQTMIDRYNKQATGYAAEANGLAQSARRIATEATREQANGDWEMAQRHMIQAHQMVYTAQTKQEQAKKVHKLMVSLNMAIPTYEKAAQMASMHSLATSL